MYCISGLFFVQCSFWSFSLLAWFHWLLFAGIVHFTRWDEHILLSSFEVREEYVLLGQIEDIELLSLSLPCLCCCTKKWLESSVFFLAIMKEILFQIYGHCAVDSNAQPGTACIGTDDRVEMQQWLNFKQHDKVNILSGAYLQSHRLHDFLTGLVRAISRKNKRQSSAPSWLLNNLAVINPADLGNCPYVVSGIELACLLAYYCLFFFLFDWVKGCPVGPHPFTHLTSTNSTNALARWETSRLADSQMDSRTRRLIMCLKPGSWLTAGKHRWRKCYLCGSFAARKMW